MDWVFVLGAGQVALYLLVLFVRANEIKNRFINKLLDCGFCRSFWSYFVLLCFFKMELTSEVVGYVPVISEALSAMIMSYVMTLVMDGWTLRFGRFEDAD